MEEIGKRLEALIAHFGVTVNAFAIPLKIKPTILYNIIKGRNNPSFDLLNNICNTFYVNANWLISGNGAMLADGTNQEVGINTNFVPSNVVSSVPLKENKTSGDNSTIAKREMSEAAKAVFEENEKRTKAYSEWLKGTIPVKAYYYRKIHETLKNDYPDLSELKDSIDVLLAFRDVIFELERKSFNDVIKFFEEYEGEQFDMQGYEKSVVEALKSIKNYKNALSKLSNKIYDFYDEMNKLGVEGINFNTYKLKENKE